MSYDDWKCTPTDEEPPCPTCDDEGVIVEYDPESGVIVEGPHPCHTCRPVSQR